MKPYIEVRCDKIYPRSQMSPESDNLRFSPITEMNHNGRVNDTQHGLILFTAFIAVIKLYGAEIPC